MRPIIKICGLMRPRDVDLCIRLGADILGFVVDYPRPVPWNLSASAAAELISGVSTSAESCVVTGGLPDKILELALKTRPDYVQLHSGESLSDTAYLAGELGKHGIRVIKALFPDTPGIEKAAADFCTAGVYALLLDPRTPSTAESGGEADIALFERVRRSAGCPVILAGGINPENAAGYVRSVNPQIIDLMTGVEFSPGVKDEKKVAALFRALEG